LKPTPQHAIPVNGSGSALFDRNSENKLIVLLIKSLLFYATAGIAQRYRPFKETVHGKL